MSYVCVCSGFQRVLWGWDSHRHAAAVCAGGAWQEQSSPGGSEDCHVDRLTQGLRKPEKEIEEKAVGKTLLYTVKDVI